MKKKIIILFLIVLFLIIIGSTALFIKKKAMQERYKVIKDNTKRAVEWSLHAQYPGCSISKELKKSTEYKTFYNSWFLIENGFLKKEDLLDVDKESYCDVYVKINAHFDNPQDQQHNCEVYYKIYLKCKDYEDKGYFKWR